MATKSTRTTARDLAAAVALGAIAPDAELVTAEAAEAAARAAAESATAETVQRAARTTATDPGIAPALSATHHECGIAGCRHGASHDGPRQPDRQLKLAAPCGAVIRTTVRALATAGGVITCSHGDPFAVAARRTYTRRAQ